MPVTPGNFASAWPELIIACDIRGRGLLQVDRQDRKTEGNNRVMHCVFCVYKWQMQKNHTEWKAREVTAISTYVRFCWVSGQDRRVAQWWDSRQSQPRHKVPSSPQTTRPPSNVTHIHITDEEEDPKSTGTLSRREQSPIRYDNNATCCKYRSRMTEKSTTTWFSVSVNCEWVSRGLTSNSTLYRSFWGRFLQVRWPNQQRQSNEGSQLAAEINFNPTRTTPLCYNMNCRQPPLA